MKFYLSKSDLSLFISTVIEKNGTNLLSGHLQKLIESAENWHDEILSSNYFLSKIFERRLKRGVKCKKVLKDYYLLPNKLFFNIEEFNSSFIDLLLSHELDPNLSLEDVLITMQKNYSEKNYGKFIRG